MTTGQLACEVRGVLLEADPVRKVFLARRVVRDWRSGRLARDEVVPMPDAPPRPDRPELLAPGKMPKRGRMGSVRSRIAMLHALAHIEYVAIDLAFDMVGRFGIDSSPQFVDDWLGVGADEALHFALLLRRLRALGSAYGALPAHDGLWEAAQATAHDRLARLAVVPMVLEARGLDVTPDTVERFRAAGDERSAAALDRIYKDEIRHVEAGVRWFTIYCEIERISPVQRWHSLVQQYFRGALKPPFNNSARLAAGLTKEFYLPLAASAAIAD